MSPTPLPLLSILIWTPIVVGFLMLFFNKGDNRYTRFYSILTSILMVILSIILLTNFDFNKHTLQFVENNPWIDNFGSSTPSTENVTAKREEKRKKSSLG